MSTSGAQRRAWAAPGQGGDEGAGGQKAPAAKLCGPHNGPPPMVRIGTPLSAHATRVLLLGSGELGNEVAIELQRLGV